MKQFKLQHIIGFALVLAFGVAYAAGVPINSDTFGQVGLAFGLMGTMGVLDTATLLEVQRVQKTPTTFWLEKCFPRQINFTTEYIAFDRVNEDFRRLAPFVAPNVQGKVMAQEGSDMVNFKPAYVKPKHIVEPDAVLVRKPGEALGSGSLTPEQRREATIASLLERHKNMHLMTREWMAAKAIIDGKVTIEGENYPKTTVDFRRDASLTVVLAGGAKWDQVGTSFPLENIKAGRVSANTLSGAVIRDVVFGAGAWSLFSSHATVTPLLDKQVRGSESDFTKMTDGFEDTVEYLGSIQGSGGAGLLRLWLYSGKYKDEAGILQDILDTDTVVGVDFASVEGHRCFGAIRDGKAGFQALDMFPKNWEDEDPWAEYIMTQSAPLMVPKTPNATFSMKVR